MKEHIPLVINVGGLEESRMKKHVVIVMEAGVKNTFLFVGIVKEKKDTTTELPLDM